MKNKTPCISFRVLKFIDATTVPQKKYLRKNIHSFSALTPAYISLIEDVKERAPKLKVFRTKILKQYPERCLFDYVHV